MLDGRAYGFLLYPTLILIFNNNLPGSILSKFLVYADDTPLFSIL